MTLDAGFGVGEMPGADRRGRGPSYPMLLGDVMSIMGQQPDQPRFFPFVSWAVQHGFDYPDGSQPFLRACGSGPEAFFAREVARLPGASFGVGVCRAGALTITAQKRTRGYLLDFAIEDARAPKCPLAIEIDGLAFHRATAEQVQKDYLRERRITFSGYTVVRFTAGEACSRAAECWRQVAAILEARR